MTVAPDRLDRLAALPPPAPGLVGVERSPDPGRVAKPLIRLHRNERLQPLPPDFLDQLRAAIGTDLLCTYPVTTELYQELSDAIGVQPEQLLLTTGSDGAIKALYQAYIRPGDTVVMLDPTYAMFAIYAQLFEAQVLPVAFDDDLQVSESDLLNRIEPGVRLVALANPNQPTGTLLDDAVLARVLERAAAAGALVVVDEAYYPFSRTTALGWLAQFPNLLVLRTFSKAAGLAGLRIGYVVGHSTVVGNLAKVRSLADVSTVAIQCARQILADPAVVDDFVAAVETGKRLLVSRVGDLGLLALPTHTNFLLIRLGPERSPAQVIDGLRARGYLVKGPFDSRGLTDCIRVTLGPPEIMGPFVDALAEVIGPPSSPPGGP